MKTTLFKSAVLATSLVLALTACTDQKGTRSKDKDKAGDSAQTPTQPTVITADATTMNADELADAGEQLVGPYTFMLADKVFDLALEKDSKNMKAQFYKNFIKRAMVMKGILTRIRPLMAKATVKQREDYERTIKQLPESPMKKFLLDGKEDIASYAQVVDLASDYAHAINDFRKFAKANQGLELTLNLNPHIFEKQISEEAANSCTMVQNSEKQYEFNCDYTAIAQKRINAADMIALQQMAAGEVMYWSLFTSYDISTLVPVVEDPSYKTLTAQQQLAKIKALPSVAKLRKDQTLSLIPELGSDFSAAVKWAMRYQDRVCPKGENVLNQRRGFLFRDGVCVIKNDDTQKAISTLDQVLAGDYMAPIKNNDGQTVDMIRIDLMAFVKNPPQDLKNVLPESVDDKGAVTAWSDKTFGGLFPDGDVDKTLSHNK
jgi:hypothetical protein